MTPVKYRLWNRLSRLLVRVAPQLTLRLDRKIGRAQMREAGERCDREIRLLAKALDEMEAAA